MNTKAPKLLSYLGLHLNICLFSFTGIFSKLASGRFASGGLTDPLLYVFLFCMVANCGIYALAWQKVIKRFPVVHRLCAPQRVHHLVPNLGGNYFS